MLLKTVLKKINRRQTNAIRDKYQTLCNKVYNLTNDISDNVAYGVCHLLSDKLYIFTNYSEKFETKVS